MASPGLLIRSDLYLHVNLSIRRELDCKARCRRPAAHFNCSRSGSRGRDDLMRMDSSGLTLCRGALFGPDTAAHSQHRQGDAEVGGTQDVSRGGGRVPQLACDS